MWNKIKSLFKKDKEEGWASGMKFRDSIKALGAEVYKDITVIYLAKPIKNETRDPGYAPDLQPIYHFWYKKEFYSKEADTYEALLELAHQDIDDLK